MECSTAGTRNWLEKINKQGILNGDPRSISVSRTSDCPQ
jgi:hypothetical protein